MKKAAGKRRAAFELPLLGSNQDSPDPESGVLPITPRGSDAHRQDSLLIDVLPSPRLGRRLSQGDVPVAPFTGRWKRTMRLMMTAGTSRPTAATRTDGAA